MPIYKLVSIYLSGKKITDFTLNTRQQCYEKFNCNSRLEGRLVENTQEIGENGHFSRTCTNIGKDKLQKCEIIDSGLFFNGQTPLPSCFSEFSALLFKTIISLFFIYIYCPKYTEYPVQNIMLPKCFRMLKHSTLLALFWATEVASSSSKKGLCVSPNNFQCQDMQLFPNISWWERITRIMVIDRHPFTSRIIFIINIKIIIIMITIGVTPQVLQLGY